MAGSSVLAALAAAILLPASARATTVRLGPEVPPTAEFPLFCGAGPCPGGLTFAQIVSPDALDQAPGSGLVTTWRVAGGGGLNLRVLRPAGEEEDELVAEGTSAPATNLKGGPNVTSLPIRAGDAIGVNSDGDEVGAETVATDTAVLFEWSPALTDEGAVQKPAFAEPFRNTEILLNADIVLAPEVSSVAPASGDAAGGTAVTIAGKYLDGATGVSFGSTPASSFSVDSPSQITAIAPASAAAIVDVRVTGPGGSSEVSPVDRYTYTTPATTANTMGVGGPGVKPTITGFSESSSRWRRGHSLPHISSAAGAPVGTTFSFSLNEPASVNLTFTQSVQGRRVAGRCVVPGHRNAGRPRCKRTLLVGSFVVSGHAGPGRVRFQGRLSRTKTLKPGSYLVSLTAREAHGLKVVSRSLSFTILS